MTERTERDSRTREVDLRPRRGGAWNDGPWVATPWRDTLGLWAYVVLGCALWAAGLYWMFA